MAGGFSLGDALFAATWVFEPNFDEMSAQAHTEDQQAQRTLTRPLPEEEEVEQPAIGLFAELDWTSLAAPVRSNPTLPPAANTATFISGNRPVSPGDENPVFNETPVLKGGLGLIEWLTACCCISLIANRFLFEWKTSGMSTVNQTLEQKSICYALGKHQDADGQGKRNWKSGREARHGLSLDKMTPNQRSFVKNSPCQKRLMQCNHLFISDMCFDRVGSKSRSQWSLD